ncbi:MAG: hypothetical protein CMK07_05330 [Ponticaulis sp.]|nr:hypothetical protein [Ponticaulis sp.]
MATYIRDTNLIGPGIQIGPASGDINYILEGVTIGSTTSAAINFAASVASPIYFEFSILGTVIGVSNAISLTNLGEATNAKFTIGSTGSVLAGGGNALTVYSQVNTYGTAEVRNDGLVQSDATAIYFNYMFDTDIVNTGNIYGGTSSGGHYAIRLSSNQTDITNSGNIYAGTGAIYVTRTDANGLRTFELTNTGLISGDEFALHTEGTHDTVNNSGTISGEVDLSRSSNYADGIDSFYNTGTVFGSVLLGEEDDVFDGETGIVHGTISGEAGDDVIRSGLGDDVIIGGAGADYMNGGLGTDTASYSGSFARVRVFLERHAATGGDADGDQLWYIENLIGSSRNDLLRGSSGDNEIEGWFGDDDIRGLNGRDVLKGESGDDILSGDGGNDMLLGGDDNDLLYGGAGDDDLYGDAGDDVLNGDDGIDFLFGGAGIDILRGGYEDDELSGGADEDELFGDNGNDVLVGGGGRDRLTGGAGADIFQYLDVTDSGVAGADRDLIEDFSQGNDVIDLSAIGATSYAGGAFTGNAGEVISYLVAGGTRTMVQFDEDGDAVADLAVTILNAGLTLTAADFLLA